MIKSNHKDAIETLHKSTMVEAAKELFSLRGFDKTTVDDIAKEAGYSKRTVYRYFDGKEELFFQVIYQSMKILKDLILEVTSAYHTFEEQYKGICEGMVRFHQESPEYFAGFLKFQYEVLEMNNSLPIIQEIRQMGKEINGILSRCIENAQEKGIVDPLIDPLPTVLFLWSSIAGAILISTSKNGYIEHTLDMPGEVFLRNSFQLLLSALLV